MVTALILFQLAGLPPATGRGPEFRRGVALGLFVHERDPTYQLDTYSAFLEEIRDVGATDVQLVVRWVQKDVRATQLAPDPTVTPDDAVLAGVVKAAARLGLRAFVMPVVHLGERRGRDWRGLLAPVDRAAWWTSYRAFVLHYARLAERSGAALLAVGSELVTMEGDEARWRALIADVRRAFPRGQLTYSANWDHFEPVPFWDALDVVGVTAYTPLSRERDPDEPALVAGWRPFARNLRGWAARSGRRYILTEVGYPSHPLAARRPWDHTRRGPPDPALQLRCYRAMFRAWQDDRRLDGLFVWNWFGVGGEDDAGYTPRGKPAAHVLRHWFGPPP